VLFRTRHWPPRRKLLDFRDADALFCCQRLISQALPIHFIPAHAKTKQNSFVVFCSAATGPEICAQCLQWAGCPASLELANPAIDGHFGQPLPCFLEF
jgi:hypothetical protein